VQDAAGDEERAGAQEKLRAAEVDWRYATYFPWGRRYVSLFRGEGEEAGGGGDLGMRARIEKAMSDGGNAALEAIRCELVVVQHVEGRADGGERQEEEDDDDDGSDGGFFE
jgi:hypothetical protein